MAHTLAAMRAGRRRKIEAWHAFGFKIPGGRPPRIPDQLRRAVVEEAEKELVGLQLDDILKAELVFDNMSEAEGFARLQRLETAMLLDLLRPAVGPKNRNRSAIALAWGSSQVRKIRVERRDKERCRLDELIEQVALR